MTDDRGIEQAMDAILDVPNAVLVIMGFGNQNGNQSSRDPYAAYDQRPPWLGKAHLIDPVPPVELSDWNRHPRTSWSWPSRHARRTIAT